MSSLPKRTLLNRVTKKEETSRPEQVLTDAGNVWFFWRASLARHSTWARMQLIHSARSSHSHLRLNSRQSALHAGRRTAGRSRRRGTQSDPVGQRATIWQHGTSFPFFSITKTRLLLNLFYLGLIAAPEFVLRRWKTVKGELCKERPLRRHRRYELGLAAVDACGAK